MTTTLLTDEQIAQALNLSGVTDYADVPLSYDLEVARAIEQAVLQSPGVQTLRKDAERYRYLRNRPRRESCGEVSISLHEGDRSGRYVSGADADVAIDAAMEKQS